ncbi:MULTISPECIES: hypothetical protein [Burkholderia]|uniref:Uncharacterized protein n=1 Tax=Burkholderia sola TaxID=2843302 RepID=A0ABV2C2X1_9BURK|nr:MULTISPECIES: hypothetical protein [Burkholderia]CAG2312008.1 hypothetical protein BCCR75384_03655 [Burkholderia cenocepacia]CAG2312024.1 hypothetical protein BCCR75389_03640 [Burkholderia cenocepacia]CAG2312091.1 hypothetical protein BCCR75386_03656 [Burkholderia cenocepacia]CAG2312113.1 hypothetical protein BCCR12632_03658 [Burkholderia cenocepacia]CAG2312115.1 hypothetical protein BCCR75387_03655 [Burkholderia cenocepacia]
MERIGALRRRVACVGAVFLIPPATALIALVVVSETSGGLAW